MKLIKAFIILMSTVQVAFACNECNANLWTIDGMLGMTQFEDVNNHDGQTAVGRLALGHGLLTERFGKIGLEAGIQSGHSMRLLFPKESIDALGGVPIEANLNPMLDVLLSFKTNSVDAFPLFAWLKGGVIYRKMQIDRPSVNDVYDFAPELQAGLGYKINERTSVNLGYQYIWGSKPSLVVNEIAETGILCHLPSQQSLMLGFSFNFG
ncbi:MAG: DUF2490 domain-containing protein [Silvanigrellaceae bacterium]|nr:DUF2490 domain-containing protein [Silvanigrellaceae bacterium]